MKGIRGLVVTVDSVIDDGVVIVDGGIIEWVGPAESSPVVLAPSSSVILPGLVDVHCHGGGGESFPDSDPDALLTAVRHHRGRGTTTMLASLVSAAPDRLVERAAALADLYEAGEVAGIHLEGPFLSSARCGAQNPAAVRPGDPALLRDVLDAGRGAVRSMTLAPETDRFAELAAMMRTDGIVPSLGHTDADAATTTRAIEILGEGPISATHLFNGMPSWHHRAPGPVPACLAAAARGAMVLELIGDGTHLAAETVRTVFELVGPDHVALVSDAMAAAGMSDGHYTLGSLDVRVSGGVARLASGDAIAGGTSTVLDVLRRTVFDAGVELCDAVRAASATPAGMIGLGDVVGRIAVGYRADLLVSDRTLEEVTLWR